MLILNHADLLDLLPATRIIEAVASGVRALPAGEAAIPDRGHLHWQGTTLLTMPAGNRAFLGIKCVAVTPANAQRDLPVTNGAMLLLHADTGAPLALMNAAALTCQRTGAVGALGVQYMTPGATDSVGIVGVGVQGLWQAIFACAVRPIRTIFYVARRDEAARRFESELASRLPDVQRARCADAHELLKRTSLVITATTASSPVLPDEPELLEGRHFIGIGSFKPSQQELPTSVCRIAGHLAIDSPAALHETGDVIRPLESGALRDADVFHIAELVTGRRTIDINRTTVFKSVGMALYDLYVAAAFYECAVANGIGAHLDF
ncbi:MAG TPA: ornithine cyclodeaminase family protein [Steroidobacteraceae bacterium]|nr:ornithine cyclodeaminase family protein [Steroidobacteraceae bacterium]